MCCVSSPAVTAAAIAVAAIAISMHWGLIEVLVVFKLVVLDTVGVGVDDDVWLLWSSS